MAWSMNPARCYTRIEPFLESLWPKTAAARSHCSQSPEGYDTWVLKATANALLAHPPLVIALACIAFGRRPDRLVRRCARGGLHQVVELRRDPLAIFVCGP